MQKAFSQLTGGEGSGSFGHRRFRASDSATAEAEAEVEDQATPAESLGRRLRRLWQPARLFGLATAAARRSSRDLPSSSSSLSSSQSTVAAAAEELQQQEEDADASAAAEDAASLKVVSETSSSLVVALRRFFLARAATPAKTATFETLDNSCEHSDWSLYDDGGSRDQPPTSTGSKRSSLPIWKRPLSWLDGVRQKRASMGYQ